MKLVKSLLLGSAAGLCAVAGAQAADLPVRKAAPVEYVRVCTASGAGFFYIPGTETCLRVGGRARFEYQFTSNRTRNSDVSGFRGQGRLNIDARTQTSYGQLRAFVRFEIMSRTGAYQTSGTQQRYANAFFGVGPDTFARAQKYVDVDKAFIQFAGFTAGRAASFFDFYAHDLEMIGASFGSDVASTNLLAYTATFGGGLSATISVEDPIFRRNPTFAQAFVGGLAGNATLNQAPQSPASGFQINSTPLGFVGTAFNGAGVPVAAIGLDVAQRNYLPDFVGALRYDQAWGSAQISAAVHEIRTGSFQANPGIFAVNAPFAAGAVTGTATPRLPSAEYGWAVQGGLKLNVPQLAPGDVLWLQVAYAQGAGSYTGVYSPQGQETQGGAFTNRFTLTQADAVFDSRGRAHLTESYSGTIAFLHYWTPEVRQGIFATHAQNIFDRSLRTSVGGPAGIAGGAGGASPFGVVNQFNPTLKSYSGTYVGSNLIWSPVRDLDIGVEFVYERLDVRGRVADANKGGAAAVNAAVVGGTGRTISTDDNYLTRIRVQRDF